MSDNGKIEIRAQRPLSERLPEIKWINVKPGEARLTEYLLLLAIIALALALVSHYHGDEMSQTISNGLKAIVQGF